MSAKKKPRQTTQDAVGIGDDELGPLLLDAGAPAAEVSSALASLATHFGRGGGIDEVAAGGALGAWGLSDGTAAMLRTVSKRRGARAPAPRAPQVLGASREARAKHKRRRDGSFVEGLRRSLEALRVDLRRAPDEDEYADDDFENFSEDEGGVNLASVASGVAFEAFLRPGCFFASRTRPPDGRPAPDDDASTRVEGHHAQVATAVADMSLDRRPPPPPARPPPAPPLSVSERWAAGAPPLARPPLLDIPGAEAPTPRSARTPGAAPGARTPVARASATPQRRPPPPGAATPLPAPPESERRSRLSSEQKEVLRSAVDAPEGRRSRGKTARHILNGQWKLGKCIGQGSFGSVYTCMDEATGQLMAVKMMAIPTSSAPLGARRAGPENELRALCSEIELMRSFEHPNIVRYLGAAVDEAQLQLYIFQEWVPGGSLAALSAHYGRLSEPVVRRYTGHIVRGLAYLHENHIIHRDIKCGNVLVDEGGVAKLADFGASHRLGADGTLTQDVKLTMRGTRGPASSTRVEDGSRPSRTPADGEMT